ncbi:MAG: bifunctional metallophosphatase/5'-nucleotidase [Patescibacteria group bacterium]
MRYHRHLLPAFLGVLAVLAAALSAAAAGDVLRVQILGVNDFHGAILETSRIENRPAGGAAVLAAWLLERERANPRTLMVHAGDMVGASQPVSALLQDEPTVEILDFLGFDVGAPGNHDFDEGPAELMRLLHGGHHPATGYFTGASFPLVAANVVDAGTKRPLLPPYAVKTVEGVPIAFIGVVTAETPRITTADGVAGLEFLDPAASINHYLPVLHEKGVEAIVVLAHEGGIQKKARIEGPIAELAAAIGDAVDVIVSGHTHTALNGVVDGKLIVQARSSGTAFADIDLAIDRTAGDVISAKAEIVTAWADVRAPDQRIAALIAPALERVRPLIERRVAETSDAITRTPNEAGESALGDLIADAQRWAAGTQIAFTNPGGIRRDLPAGAVTWGVLYECQPFGNNLMRFRMTGDQIRRLLEEQWATGRMLQIAGLRYTWDAARPPGDRVVKLALADGEPVARDKTYTAAANSFLAAGGDGFTVFAEIAAQEAVMCDLDALVGYLQTLKQPIAARIDGRITKEFARLT